MAVYFIRNETTRAIKVGFSKNPKKRLRGFRTANSELLTLMGEIEGEPVIEKSIQTFLSREKVRGEWYRGPLTEGWVSSLITGEFVLRGDSFVCRDYLDHFGK